MTPSLPSLLDVGLFTERREHESFDLYRAESEPPLHIGPEPDEGFYVLTRHSHVWEAATNTEKFKSGLGTQIANKRAEGSGAPSVHNADAPYHRHLRDFGRRALAQPLLEIRRPRIREIVRSVILAAPRNEEFDFVERVALEIPMTVFGEVLGIPAGDRETLVKKKLTTLTKTILINDQKKITKKINSNYILLTNTLKTYDLLLIFCKQLNLIPHRFHVDLPETLIKEIIKCKDNTSVRKVGVEWCIEQSRELKKAGVPFLHYYTMGKSDNI